MSKVDIKRLDSVTKNDTTATKQINDNFQALQAAIENTVSRDGTVPNYMDADLDLNSYRIINAGDPVGERDVITLKYFEEKAGGAIEAAEEAKASASKAASSAQSALVASNNAIGQLSQAEGLLTAAEQYVDAAKADINSAVDKATTDINNIVSNAEGSITNIAVTEANKAIANAAQEATDTAKANVNNYVDGTVKPSLQTYVDQAQEDANSAATSMEQAALSATAASNYASNASADADNAAESAGLAANSAAAAKVSENNAKASETNTEATKAEVEAIAKLASFGNIGDIKYTSRTDVPNGGAWCNGALYTKAQFPDVYQMLVDGKLQSTTVSAFDNSVSANGSCGFFGLDTANERFKVPMLKNVYLKAGQAPSMFGAESLPNIKGNLGSIVTQRSSNPINDYKGAFKANGADNYSSSSTSNSFRATGVTFNASRSSSTYKDNAKVNPDHVVYRAYVVLYSKVLDVPASVDKALIWAEGTDAQVQALGGEKSAKGWAEASTAVNYTNITNCITEIPQDINIELNSGTLTLKAGSKVYVPDGKNDDGSLKFDVVVIASDISLMQSWGNSQTFLLFYDTNGLRLRIYDTGQCYSGTTSVSDGAYYNTNDNKLYVYDGGSLNFTASLPIAIITGQSPTITSIDQVFNGFGYIGSTVFALPGVKGLIPNGRNADGSLKNIEFTLDKVLTETTNYSTRNDIFLNQSIITQVIVGNVNYNDKENYNKGSNFISKFACIGQCNTSSGVVSNFNTKQPFHALDYNDKSTISGWSMPSNRYINLTLGASGSTYTAPANGWVILNKFATGIGQEIRLTNQSNQLRGYAISSTNGAGLDTMIPCRKGDSIYIYYSAVGGVEQFRFIYAEGEN